MASGEYRLLVDLQARLLAQQMFMRSVLTAALMNTPDPLASLEELRSEELLAADQAVRPKGAYEDEVWAKALEAFHYELNQIAARITEHSGRLERNTFGKESGAESNERVATETPRALQDA